MCSMPFPAFDFLFCVGRWCESSTKHYNSPNKREPRCKRVLKPPPSKGRWALCSKARRDCQAKLPICRSCRMIACAYNPSPASRDAPVVRFRTTAQGGLLMWVPRGNFLWSHVVDPHMGAFLFGACDGFLDYGAFVIKTTRPLSGLCRTKVLSVRHVFIDSTYPESVLLSARRQLLQ